MVLVFILLGIFIILLAISFIILLSTFRIEIKDLEVGNIGKSKAPGYAIILSLALGNKLKWISFHLNDEKMRKTYSKMQLEKIDFKKLEKNFKWEDLKIIRMLQIKMPYLNLKVKLGTESPVITAFSVAIFSSLISIALPHFATDFKKENYQYVIEPIYQNQNLYKIKFNCIIQVKMVHIINVIFLVLERLHFEKMQLT